jgi:capsular exopolysaccharide synthesis family protein
LDLVYQELQETRSRLSQAEPFRAYEGIAAKAEEAQDTLDLAAAQLVPIQSSLSLDENRKLVGIEDYIDSVSDDLNEVANQIRGASGSNLGLPDEEKISLQGQLLAYTSGLEAATEDLDDLRNQMDTRDYGRVLSAIGHIQTAVGQIQSLITDLENTTGVASLYDSLSEVMGWIQESGRSLRAVADNFLSLQVIPGTEEEQDIAVRASNELDGVSLTLDITSTRLQSLSTSIADPILQARLNSAAAQLATSQSGIADSSARLKAISQVGDITMSDRINTVRDRIQKGADGMWIVVEGLRVDNQATIKVATPESTNQAYASTSSIARSLDVASRQLQGLLSSSADPLLVGELGSLVDQLSSAQRDVLGISQRLANLTSEDNSSSAFSSEFILIHNRLQTAATSLVAAAQAYQKESNAAEGINQDDVGRIKETIDVGAAILNRVAEDLVRLQLAETEPLRYGQLVVMTGRIREAQLRSEEISVQLGELQGSPSPQDREMRDLRRQLELSLLQPQETGITQVDLAVLPQFAKQSSFFSQVRIPLGAVAGFMLGSLAVLFKAQLDPTVRSQTQLRDRLGFATLGVVPREKASGLLHPPMVSNGNQPAFSEAVQLVGTGLSRPISNGVRSFLITSAGPKEGKTMLSVNLAHVLAQYGHRVLLVDGNLRKPEVAKVLNLPEEEGLATALAQQVNPLDFVVETGAFSVLPAGSPPDNPVELLSSPAMSFALQQAQRKYDLVLVDGPPALGFAEVKALAKGVNGSILVVRSGATRLDAVKETNEQLEAAGIPVVAAVLNFAADDECSHLHHETYSLSFGKKGR